MTLLSCSQPWALGNAISPLKFLAKALSLFLRDLQLDSPIAPIGVLAVARVERLEFTKARGGEAVGRDTFRNEILYDRDGARRRQLPIGGKGGRLDLALVGMAIDPHHPRNFRRNLMLEVDERGGQPIELRAPRRIEARLSRIEQDFRLEDEAVADDSHAGPVAENLAQAAEDIGTVAGKLLNLLRQRHIEPGTEIGNLGLRFAVAVFGGCQGILDRGKLAAQGGDLLVQNFDLGQSAR